MERKSLVPLVKEVCTIVRKTRVSVKEQKRQEKNANSSQNIHKSFFEDGALKRANEISGRLNPEPALIGEEFER